MIWVGLSALALFGAAVIYVSLPGYNGKVFSPRRMGLSVIPVVIAFGVYIVIGNPTLPAKPYAERAGERNLAAAAAVAGNVTNPNYKTDQQIQRLLNQIVLSLEVNPRNLQGWVALARGSLRLGNIERAVAAFAQAYALSGHNPLLAIEYADTRITAQNGQIDSTSRDLVLHALGQMPNHLLARYYYGIMLKQSDKPSQALNVLRDLYRDLPKDDPLGNATESEIKALQALSDARTDAQ
ncbi:tetratricopeptide repeat protein [Thalassospira sp. SM2505]|uniref:Cytochrome C biogenesis protein CcmI n=1 Tax=Thalassospira profundimaris TaxID=502049 RepID=A0A367WXD4_9PROT|nr:cytochrome C biogenesis protein CcmI [Thalassospira profundimaris]RCK46104.1 cytochrome C biogenesis protein CcmI [Thalassospira profundimaris]